MLVLGASNDDRGAQLEALASHLLQHLGYEQIVCNQVGPGGHELDLTAVQRVPVPGGVRPDNWVVECKAHARPLAMPDWLKFVGKVFVENQTRAGEVFGCLIALSGVNGNVSGNYQSLQQHCNTLRLLGEEEVTEAAIQAYALPPPEEVVRRIGRHIALPFLKVEYAYYDNGFSVMVFPTDTAYGLFRPSGELIDDEEAWPLVAMIGDIAPEYAYTNIRERAESLRLHERAEREIIVRVMMAVSPDRGALMEETETLGEGDLAKALESLVQRGFLVQERDRYQLDEDAGVTAEVYRHLFSGEFRTDVLGCEHYDRTVEQILIPHALEQYPGLYLAPDQLQRIAHLAKLSPAALMYVLSPDPMMVRALDKTPDMKNMQAWLGEKLIHRMHRALYNEFGHNSSLSRYFLRTRRLREIELSETYTFKSESDQQVVELGERVAVFQMVPQAGGGYVPVLLTPEAPQPDAIPYPND